MNESKRIEDWQRMYDELNDPDMLEEARAKAQVKKSIEDKRKDTGYE